MIHMYFMVWKELIYAKMPLLLDLGGKKEEKKNLTMRRNQAITWLYEISP